MLYFLKGNTVLKYITKLFVGLFEDIRMFECIENYTSKKPLNIKYISSSSLILSYSSPKFDQQVMKDFDLVNVSGFKKYAIELKNAQVIGGSSLILLDKQSALYEIKCNDIQRRYSYSDEALHCYNDKYCLIKSTASEIGYEEAISLAGNFSWNYYHLLYEILTKFEQINDSDLDLNIPVLVDQICFGVPQYLELLTLLNTRGRKLLALEKGKRYMVKRLYVFSCPNIIPPDYLNISDAKAEDILYDLHSLNYLRTNLLNYSSNTDFPKRIFISRSKASQRRKYNEEQIYKALTTYGFKIIYPEEYSVADQIALFGNADFIAGGTGAAYSNLLCCKKSCKVICFTNYSLPISIFSTIASYVGFELLYLSDESKKIEKIGDIHDPFKINIDRLNKIVLGWIQ